MDIERLVHNLFGFQIKQAHFCRGFHQSEHCEQLKDVAVRVYFADHVRHRFPFVHPSFTPGFGQGELGFWLRGQQLALQLYLMCTCVDALASKSPPTFHEWLQVSRPGKKAKYHTNDESISDILHDVLDSPRPDELRRAAARLYTEIYLPHFGNRRGFLQFFSELPLPLKDLLESVYVISDCLYEEIPDGSVWEHVHKQWTGKSQEERIRSIAQYLYHHRRNPYTHRAKAAPPRETRDWRQTMPEEWSSKSGDFDTAYDPLRDVAREGDKYRIVRFRGEPREDESLLLRLAVAIACLRKLAYATDAKYVQGFRRYQIRREIMYLSMREMDIVFEMLRYYNGENQEHPLYSPLQWLPVFPLAEIRKLRPYLRTDTTLERGIDKRIQEYLGRLARVSTSIKTFNKAHFPQGRLFPLSQPEVTRKARAETYAAIRDMAELRGLAEVMHNIYRWLDDLADRIIW